VAAGVAVSGSFAGFGAAMSHWDQESNGLSRKRQLIRTCSLEGAMMPRVPFIHFIQPTYLLAALIVWSVFRTFKCMSVIQQNFDMFLCS
jgi:hypothetical protein